MDYCISLYMHRVELESMLFPEGLLEGKLFPEGLLEGKLLPEGLLEGNREH